MYQAVDRLRQTKDEGINMFPVKINEHTLV